MAIVVYGIDLANHVFAVGARRGADFAVDRIEFVAAELGAGAPLDRGSLAARLGCARGLEGRAMCLRRLRCTG
jgi:hypothetical protein